MLETKKLAPEKSWHLDGDQNTGEYIYFVNVKRVLKRVRETTQYRYVIQIS